MNIERAMARIVRIDDVIKHPNADSLDICTIGGWKVVTLLNQFQKDDLVVFCEPDSWIPTDIAPFLSKGKEPREFNGIKGERLRTVKLRGIVSSGLILPLSPTCDMIQSQLFEGLDVSYPLGIQKYEAPIPACLHGTVKGNFPTWGKKTDQQRIQNLVDEFESAYNNDILFEISIKLDGSSMSIGHNSGELVVCSRNFSLELDQQNNTYVNVAKRLDIFDKLKNVGNILISGELCGPNIQKNPEKLKTHEFFVFDVWDIDNNRYFPREERINIVNSLGLSHVPVVHQSISLKELKLNSVNDILDFAEGPSLYSNIREGLVFKSIDGNFSFKAISNKYLLFGT